MKNTRVHCNATMNKDQWYSRYLPFAGAPVIVRANQKDEYFIKEMTNELIEMLRAFKGSVFVHNNKNGLEMLSKLIYFVITTGFGARTLGEEYVDINYVTRDGKKRIGMIRRVLFVISYVIFPYLISKLSKYIGNNKVKKILGRLTFFNVLDAMNLHLAVFYFFGKYYHFSKRLLGMRYVLSYKPSNNSSNSSRNYELIGGAMMLQLLFKYGSVIKNILEPLWNNNDNKPGKMMLEERERILREKLMKGEFRQLIKMKNADNDETNNNGYERRNNKNFSGEKTSIEKEGVELTIIDLADEAQLPYLPEQSRSCMLCLSPMKDPSCTTCGHLFCWGCIQGWCKERTECPLCRAPITASQVLPLR